MHWASVRSRRGLAIADSLHPGRIPLVFVLGFPLASPLPEIQNSLQTVCVTLSNGRIASRCVCVCVGGVVVKASISKIE